MTVEPRRSARVAAAAALDINKEANEPIVNPRPAKKAKVAKSSTDAQEEEDNTVDKRSTTKQSKQLEIGDELPEGLVLHDQDDNELNLKQITLENKIVVIFAYPRASTPGCTKQACGFRDSYPKFTSLSSKVAIFGLSADSVKAQKTFQTKQNLPYQLISDPKHELIGPLGATKEVTKVTRSHWIFKDGKLWIKKLKISPVDSFEGALKTVVAELQGEKVEEPKVEEAKVEEAKVEEAKAEEAKVEEPKVEEGNVEN